MKESNTYDIYYDKESDFLEVFFGAPSKCYAEEIEPGVFIRKDAKTNEVKSIGILSFKKRAQKPPARSILKKVLEKINLKLPIEIRG